MPAFVRCTRDFGAPCAVIVCADTGEAWTRKYDGKTIGDIDASIVTDHMMLAAASLGLDTLWICMFKPEAVREEFRLPEHVEPVNILLRRPRPSRPAAQTARGNGRIRNLLTGTESPNSPTAKAAVFANLRIRAHRKIPATTDSKK